MTLSLILYLVAAGGLGAWFAGWPLGLRTFVGWALVPVLLFVASGIAGLPLSVAGQAVLGLAVVGGMAATVRAARRGWQRPLGRLAAHPVGWLGLLAVGLTAVVGPDRYVPLEWDELSNWLAVTRQMFVADVPWRADMTLANPGYTPGWHLAMVFPGLFFEDFAEVRSLAAFTSGLVAFGGLVFDLLGDRPRRGGPGGHLAARWAAVAAVLALMPYGWLPPNALIEPPQLLLTVAPLLILVARPASPGQGRRWALAAGLLLAAGYLVKAAALVLLAAVPFLWWRLREGRGVGTAARLVLPFAAVFVAWKVFAPVVAASCLADPLSRMTPEGLNRVRDMLRPFAVRGGTYLADALAMPLGVAGLAGLLAGAWRGHRVVVAGSFAYLAAYVAAIAWSFAICFRGYQLANLSSLERYLGLALEAVLLAGVLAGARLLLGLIGPSSGRWPARAGGLAAAATVALLALTVHRSAALAPRLADPFAPGHLYPSAYVEKRLPVMAGMADLLQVAAATRTDKPVPRVTVIAQNTDGFERFLLAYLGLGSIRDGPLRHFAVAPTHSWSATPGREWTVTATADEIRADLGRSEIIWPRHLDSVVGQVLTDFTDSPSCRTYIRAFLLWRPDPDAPYRCVFNEGLIGALEGR